MDARNWELVNLVEPGVDGRPPVDASPRPRRERLVKVLTNLGKDGLVNERFMWKGFLMEKRICGNLEPGDSSTVRTVVGELALVSKALSNPTKAFVSGAGVKDQGSKHDHFQRQSQET